MGKHSYSRSRSRSKKKSKKEKKSKKHKKSDRSRSRSYSYDRKYYRRDEDLFKPKNEPSQWLYIKDVLEDIPQETIENQFQDISIQAGTSMYEEVRPVPLYQQVYIQYVSSQIASKVLYYLRGQVKLDGRDYEIDFYQTEQQKLQQSIIPAYMDSTQDWICEKCDYKNFAKRPKCNKCDRPKSQVCKALITSSTTIKNMNQQQDNQNTSLMVRGNVITTVTTEQLLDVFSKFADVKDVRLVKNKQTGAPRDFAFIEFYTIKDSEKVLELTGNNFKILGSEVSVMVSKNKKTEEVSQQMIQTPVATSMANIQYYNYINQLQQAPIIAEVGETQNQSQGAMYAQYLQAQQNQQQQLVNSVIPNMGQQQTQQQQQQQQQLASGFIQQNNQLNIQQQSQSQSQNNSNNKNNSKSSQQPQQQNSKQSEKEIAKQRELQEKLKQKNKELEEQNQKQKLELEKQKAEELKQKLAEKEKKLKEQNKAKKAEMNLKKWEKQQQILQQQTQIEQIQQMSQGNPISGTSDVSLQKQQSEAKPLIIICSLCKKKFPSEEKLKLHEKLSELHKVNWKRLC